ncbi:MAG: hypothetical protein JO354_12400 [Verrucomicrobia bacterium]|nr:hypothetical protein [Verrucomicrobiota bacterium]
MALKRLTFLAAMAVACPIFSGQSQTTDEDRQQLITLIKDVSTQQTQLAANQAKIDEKMATLAEAIRQARIYASRGGR